MMMGETTGHRANTRSYGGDVVHFGMVAGFIGLPERRVIRRASVE